MITQSHTDSLGHAFVISSCVLAGVQSKSEEQNFILVLRLQYISMYCISFVIVYLLCLHTACKTPVVSVPIKYNPQSSLMRTARVREVLDAHKLKDNILSLCFLTST